MTQQELGSTINVTKVSICCYEKGTRMNIVYPVIRIYLSKPTSKIKYKYWCNKKSTYFHIYDKKDNYDKFIEIMNSKGKTS